MRQIWWLGQRLLAMQQQRWRDSELDGAELLDLGVCTGDKGETGQGSGHVRHLEGLHTHTITVFGVVRKGTQQSDSDRIDPETPLTVSVHKNRKMFDSDWAD